MKSYNPIISIITPVWNGLPYIRQCVESVLSQEIENWEMIISDDGSTDGTREYLDTLLDSRIIIYKQIQNLGIFGNLNYIFSVAKAPISQILCQDDYFTETTSLNTILNYWKVANNELGFVRFNHSSENLKRLVAYEYKVVPKIINKSKADIWFYIFGNIPGNLSNVSLRTKIVQEVGWFNQAYPFAGDMDFWIRAARAYDMGIEKKAVTFIRRHEKVASSNLNKNGELVVQTKKIVTNLYQSIVINDIKNVFALKLHGTLNYDSYQREIGLKMWLLKNNKKYLQALQNTSQNTVYTLNTQMIWLFFFLSFGGRLLRVTVAAYLINRLTKI